MVDLSTYERTKSGNIISCSCAGTLLHSQHGFNARGEADERPDSWTSQVTLRSRHRRSLLDLGRGCAGNAYKPMERMSEINGQFLIVLFINESWYRRDIPQVEQLARGSRLLRLVGVWQIRVHNGYFFPVLTSCHRLLAVFIKPVIVPTIIY
jgi:hypothetical protein